MRFILNNDFVADGRFSRFEDRRKGLRPFSLSTKCRSHRQALRARIAASGELTVPRNSETRGGISCSQGDACVFVCGTRFCRRASCHTEVSATSFRTEKETLDGRGKNMCACVYARLCMCVISDNIIKRLGA